MRRGQPRRFVTGHNLRNLPKSDAHRKSISEGQRRAWRTKRQRRPVGTKRISSSGYVIVKVVEGKGHWRPEHVLMIEAEIGRRLTPGEHVHHINGIRTDNRRENLHLFRSASLHALAHGSLDALLDQLLGAGVVEFDRKVGRYRWGRFTPIPG